MLSRQYRAYTALAALAGTCALWSSGCATDRPSRNGVFNENQYLRKDFLIAAGDGSTTDEGWFYQSTIIAASTPNPLGSAFGANLFDGVQSTETTSNFVRFQVTQDKLELVDLRELSNNPAWIAQDTRIPEIVNAWPITNVDLKYRVNLDGERTNFFEENQELDWEQRQWVKINFANNNMSDLYAFGGETNTALQNCADLSNSSATLVTDSFQVDTTNKTWQYAIDLTIPISFSDANAATCIQAFGGTANYQNFLLLGRQNVTLRILTSFVRPSMVTDGSYVPMIVDEKDPIHRKYGAFEQIRQYRDPDTGLLGAIAQVMRFNPNKPITFYFSPGMPKVYTDFFVNVVAPQTNAQVFANTKGSAKLNFLNYNDATTYGDGQGPARQLGDPRYSFISWHSDLDTQSGLLGVAQFFNDPRTGETISATVNAYEGNFADSVEQRLDLFLQTVGAEYLLPNGEFDDSKYPPTCSAGQTIALVPADIAANFNRASTVYNKIQQYLQRPFANYGYLGPADFLPQHDQPFYDTFYAVLPYQTYADPQANPYVIPDGTPFATQQAAAWAGFQAQAAFEQLAGQVDHGLAPFDASGGTAIPDATAFYGQWSNLMTQVTDMANTQGYGPLSDRADDANLYSYFDVYKNNGRHCVAATGKWETREVYVANLIQSLNMTTAVHEFGHTLGLRHNFMGSIDQRNFPKDPSGNVMMYSSSIMEYSQRLAESFFETNANTSVWGPYDIGALGWIYSNNLSPTQAGPNGTPVKTTPSGQTSATAPWQDPLGFKGGTETQFLYCTDEHIKYTPLCQQFDMGTTPAEIIANAIEAREWNYLWTNFRLYHKFFSTENYATQVATDFTAMRRFESMWGFDWSSGELNNLFRVIGIANPDPTKNNIGDYYNYLSNQFDLDASVANQLIAAYHRAIIEQGSGERPYVTVFDPFYGDTTQQGIQIDKVTATTNLSTLWPAVSNFDPSQSAGIYISSLGGQIGDAAYNGVSQDTLADYLGASFATFLYAQVGPIANFAASTHSPTYSGNLELQAWVGGWAFNRERDLLDYLHNIAVVNHFQNCDENGFNCSPCTSLDNCTWDPRQLQVKGAQINQSDRYNRFVAPDGRTYIWGYISSRNQWVLADKDRNIATYTLMLNWTTDVVNGEDTGYNGASSLEYYVRYAVDAFTYYDGSTLAGSTSN